MGDHARRKMIVRITQVIRQNPAYRPSALQQPPMLTYRRLFLFKPVSLTSSASMKRSIRRSILILLVMACSTGRVPISPPATPPLPQPAAPRDVQSWNFSYRSDTLRYRISRSAAIESQGDSGTRREVSTNDSHEVLSLSVIADTVRYTATVDSFSTTAQGLIGPVQPVVLPVQISGVMDSTTSEPDSLVTSLSSSCDPVQSSLSGDVRSLLIRVPTQLTLGLSWRDSTVRIACYATIPMKATVIRRFSVVGAAEYDGRNTVLIQRTDSINAHGEGRQQQHQLIVDVAGTGSASYHLSPEQSSVVRLTTNQDLNLAVRASGRTSRFRETAKEEFSLLP